MTEDNSIDPEVGIEVQRRATSSPGGIDDFIRAVESDNHADRLSHQNKATPIDYARLRSRTTGKKLQPQRVYYMIRNGKLRLESCICGRNVIDIDEADKLFGFHQETDQEDE